MSVAISPPPVVRPTRPGRRPPRGRRTTLFAHGEPMMWLTGGALALAVFMILGLLTLVLVQGFGTFWPGPLERFELDSGRVALGEVTRVEDVPESEGLTRRMVRTGNFEFTGEHFLWVDDAAVVEATQPEWAVLLERLSWGRFYGFPRELRIDGEVVAEGPEATWAAFEEHHGAVRERWHERRALEMGPVGDINHELEAGRLAVRQAGLDHGLQSEQHRAALAAFAALEDELEQEYAEARAAIDELDAVNAGYELVLATADGRTATLPLTDIVRAIPANRLGWFERLGVYLSRWWEFLFDEPREANSEGGVWPAIFGTVLMTMIMTVFVVPFGVLAALYLREYAKQGLMVSVVRVAVNNLAGVPSIVFGVFGLGFFCYMVGGGIDAWLFEARLPSPTFGTGGILWASLTLALLTLPVVIVATEEALAAVPNSMREGSYACGASKWQTIRRIVLPKALPGIMTGVVLAVARGAGEVAPLMLVGAAKLAPEMPFDLHAPFLHLERSFMHLGFHIYDLGFQSQNSEAARPMIYTTTLLLIGIVVMLDLAAINIRARLRRRYGAGRI